MDVHDLEWTDETLESFWTFWGDKVHTYFAEAYGAAIVWTAARFLRPGQLCVDYGCGSGGLTAALLNAGFRVAAIDYSPKSVEDVTVRFSEHDLFAGARRVADLATSTVEKLVVPWGDGRV